MNGLTDRPPFIVPNGIKIEKEFLYLADEYRIGQNTIPKLLFLSNLSEKKGVPELITALGILKKRNYVFHTSIVGNEWYMTFAEAQKLIDDEGLQDMVKLEGPKFGKDKFIFLAHTDLFVFPTYFELFPGVILEAMQFGKAIVSTFEGSIPDIIDNGVNGLLVERRNAGELAEAIASLLDDPNKRLQLAAAAKAKFFNEFTLEAFESKMRHVFEQVMAK
jgi:glycosyltransferase involved in cell wall biosynthesis